MVRKLRIKIEIISTRNKNIFDELSLINEISQTKQAEECCTGLNISPYQKKKKKLNLQNREIKYN